MPMFPFNVEVGSGGKEIFTYEEAKFTDGYEQVVPQKINHRRQEVTVRGRYSRDEFRGVQEFLRLHDRGEPIQMVDELSGDVMSVRVKEYTWSFVDPTWVEVNFTVKQVFFP